MTNAIGQAHSPDTGLGRLTEPAIRARAQAAIASFVPLDVVAAEAGVSISDLTALLPPCPPWCAGDCAGGDVVTLDSGRTIIDTRLHEHTVGQLTGRDGQGGQTDVRVYIERCDDIAETLETGVSLELSSHGEAVPAGRLDDADVLGLTARYSDNQCRYLLASYLGGVLQQMTVSLSVAQLRGLARTALEAADLLDDSNAEAVTA
jgi:hypothetical protein